MPALREAIKSDVTLSRMAVERLAALDNLAQSCRNDAVCVAQRFEWSEAAITEAGRALQRLYSTSAAVKAFVDGALRASGAYVRYHKLPPDELLERAWEDSIHGVNRMIDVYGLGKAPRYPEIDSPTYDIKSNAWRNLVESVTALIAEQRAELSLFFQPAMRFALELMLLDNRDEAGRFEPMETGENAAAFAYVKSVDWSKYPYSVILVPGAGNDRPGVRLSPDGKMRDEIAANRFREGKAPLLIVSGGFVHPPRTEYSEAIEMKHDLIARFGIPAEAIMVDPHARHTTTNMRNAARLVYRYGLPFEKKALISTDLSQSAYIQSVVFEKRCVDELGYLPYRLLGRASPFDLEFLPLIESLQIDPQDPLDP